MLKLCVPMAELIWVLMASDPSQGSGDIMPTVNLDKKDVNENGKKKKQ